MANRKKEVYKPKPMTEGKRNLVLCQEKVQIKHAFF